MAEMKQKEVKQNGLNLVTSVQTKVEIEHKKRVVDSKINELAEKTAAIIQSQGYDSSMAQIMIQNQKRYIMTGLKSTKIQVVLQDRRRQTSDRHW